MRYIVPLFAVILVASIFPNNSFSLLAYIAIAFYSVFLTSGLFRNASPIKRRQILIVSSGAFIVALGIGALFYLR
jgi:hypothetical protein